MEFKLIVYIGMSKTNKCIALLACIYLHGIKMYMHIELICINIF